MISRLSLLLALLLTATACTPGSSLTAVSPKPTATVPAPATPTPDITPTASPAPSTPLVPTGPTIVGSVGRRSSAGNVVALTFDDGLSAQSIRELVAVAVATRTPITFFPTGRSLQQYPELWRAVAAAGFPIANHTVSHPFLRDLRERKGEAAVIRQITGFATIAAAIEIPIIAVLRPPYGDRDRAIDALAARAGFPTVAMWDTSFADTAPICNGSIAGHVRAATRGKAGSIVIGHARPALTPRILASVIAAYRARGLEPVALPTLLTGEVVEIDWARALEATSAPAVPGGARVPTAAPVPYDPTDRRAPGELEGRC